MLIRLQVRSAGVPTLQTCVVLDTEEIKPNIIVSLITDVFSGRIGVVPLHCGVLNPLTRTRFLRVSFGS
jgi:hypothetical protein